MRYKFSNIVRVREYRLDIGVYIYASAGARRIKDYNFINILEDVLYNICRLIGMHNLNNSKVIQYWDSN